MATVVTVAGVVGPTVGVVETLGLVVGETDGVLEETLGPGDVTEGIGVAVPPGDAVDDAALVQPVRARTRTAITTLPRARAVRRVVDVAMTTSPGRCGRRPAGCRA
jgi:hypothetical protein